MSFDELFELPPREPPPERPEIVRPSWWPPDDELGVTVPNGRILARSERAVVALPHTVAYSAGVQLELFAHARGLRAAEANRLHHEQHLFEPGDAPSAGFLRVGVELSDGTRLSNLAGHPPWAPDAEPSGPFLMPFGGGGGSSGGDGTVTIRPGYWLWPLPPPGALRLSIEWPALHVALTIVDLDADELRAAAGRATPLW